MIRRALVVGTRVPEIDRDSGSLDLDNAIRVLLADGWQVSFVAAASDGDERQAVRLRSLGVATHIGLDAVDELVMAHKFDLAYLAFWQPASEVIPVLRERSPETRIIVNSMDVHFVREARRRFGLGDLVDEDYGARMAAEISTYRRADAVVAVSGAEVSLLAAFLESDRCHELPLAEKFRASPVPLAERTGQLFVGNFRHLPNVEAIEFYCAELLPRFDRSIIAQHPLSVVGNRLDEKVRSFAPDDGSVNMIGWVPTIEAYLEQARVCVVPLLHGAGVKRKVIQALQTGTPVVTTAIGAEGLDLVPGVHAMIAESPGELVDSIEALLVDDELWTSIADAGRDHVADRHSLDRVDQQLRSIISEVLRRPPNINHGDDRLVHARRRETDHDESWSRAQATLLAVAGTARNVVVVNAGDPALLSVGDGQATGFPLDAGGDWIGYHPGSAAEATDYLRRIEATAARWLAFPSSTRWWLNFYPEFSQRLDTTHFCMHRSDDLVLYRLNGAEEPSENKSADPTDRLSEEETAALAFVPGGAEPDVTILGRFVSGRSGPPRSLVEHFQGLGGVTVRQLWVPALENPPNLDDIGEMSGKWRILVDDSIRLPEGWIDSYFKAHLECGARTSQPAGAPGSFASPLAWQVPGCFARVTSGHVGLPLLVESSVASRDDHVVIDAHPVQVRGPASRDHDDADVKVSDVLLQTTWGLASGIRSRSPLEQPDVSVVIATYERPRLLGECLQGFVGQNLDGRTFEVVVVDDGSPSTEPMDAALLFAGQLPLTAVRSGHGGRSAAKNLAVQLARGKVVLFFDDDDRPAPDLLLEHLRGHDESPGDHVAILGYTDWAPELKIEPLMHFVTDVDKMLFAYGNLVDGDVLGWKGFWEGRISCKRRFLLQHALHDPRLNYSIDVEMAYRLEPFGLEVRYRESAKSVMARGVSLEDFCRRAEAKAEATALIGEIHEADDVIQKYLGLEQARKWYPNSAADLEEMVVEAAALEAVVSASRDYSSENAEQLFALFRKIIRAHHARGLLDAPTRLSVERLPPTVWSPPEMRSDEPVLSIVVPVWSRTRELADMAARTLDRIWHVASVPTEVVVIDNGSPFKTDHPGAVVHTNPTNLGVSCAWNQGLTLSRGQVIAVLNSDCLVSGGWDAALVEASLEGRRIAFPYTDHVDGRGVRQPDQGGTAGWCFAGSRAVFDEIGEFDERFSPAFGEDTDYWHRAWELGIELAPVPAAHVTHERRATSGRDPHMEWLLQGHRYKYGWKHGVDPHRAPPYYGRAIVEYQVTGRATVGGFSTK